jgi:alpha-ribazole phosphatase
LPLKPQSMRLFLLRHTQPEGGQTWTILGHKDVPLSESGMSHCRDLAAQFEGMPLEAVYSSDLERSWRLADMLAKSRGLPAHRLKGLRELDCGCMDGMKRDKARELYPEVFEGLRRDPLNYRIPEGETMLELAGRVRPVIDEIRGSGLRLVLIVGHAVVNRIVLCDALNLPLEYAYRIEQSYGGINVVEYGNRRPTVHLVNSPVIPAVLTAPFPEV